MMKRRSRQQPRGLDQQLLQRRFSIRGVGSEISQIGANSVSLTATGL